MLVLGIESSCDETAAALVRDGCDIISNVIGSSADMHRKYGGVFPEIASRHHVDIMIPIIDEALKNQRPDLIAVANGPGLMGPLLMGVTTAKSLSHAWNIPFVGVDHVHAHLYAAMMGKNPSFPALGLVVSGGHTFLAKITSLTEYEIISSTVDDAIGEAFDKVASMLSLPYPGGPEIEKLAKSGDPDKYPFKSGTVKGKPLHFSFSGLKTNVLYTTQKISIEDEAAHIAASFQKAALKDIAKKTLQAADGMEIYVGGGVSQNGMLRALLEANYPEKSLCLDNGAMVAGLGYHIYNCQGPSPLSLTPYARK